MTMTRAHLKRPPRRNRLLMNMPTRAMGEDGFTMVELVVAIFIFAIVVTGVAAGMSSALNLTRQDRNRSIAANLASQEMDTVRSTNFTDLTLGQVVTTQSIDGVQYTITRETGWVSAGAAGGACQATGSDPAYLSVDVSVVWPNMQGVKPPSSNTVVTPPVGTFDPNSGNVAVTVKNAAGQSQAGVPVNVVETSESQTTTSDGCAFFAYEPAGAYTINLNRAGYVSDQGVAVPTQTATVQAGGTIPLTFQYDKASTLSLTLQGAGGAPLPTDAARFIPVSLGNTHIVPSGLKVVAGVAGTSRTAGSLFPYTDGWDTFAGSCSDADPEGIKPVGGPYYVGASRTAPISVTPGNTSSGTVPLPALTVQTRTLVPAARPNVQVTATHVVPGGAAVDPGCTAGEVYTLGNTNASGNLTVALPYGKWSISAAGTATTATVQLSPLSVAGPVTISW
jgi:prepilin-type N-terminal cleavage/methylation domain-containing protein